MADGKVRAVGVSNYTFHQFETHLLDLLLQIGHTATGQFLREQGSGENLRKEATPQGSAKF